MKQIEIFVIPNKHTVKENSIRQKDTVLESCTDSLQKQATQFGIDAIVTLVDVENIPTTSDASLVGILDENMFIRSDYLAAVVSINNLHRDAAVLCGPICTRHKNNSDWFTKAIEENYKNYSIPVTEEMLLIDISDEEHNFPPINGCFFSGRIYNEIGGYTPIASPRGYLRNNKHFIKMMSTKGRIIHSSSLKSIYFISEAEFDVESISEYYYDLGYQDGILISYKTDKERLAETWHRFIESPEMFDNTSPRWLLSDDEETNYSYAEKLVFLKCKYQVGFFEGMLGRKII